MLAVSNTSIHLPWWAFALVGAILVAGFFERQQRATRKARHRAYLRSPEWRATRKQALASAGGKCQDCGATHDLHVHHLTYVRHGQELPRDLRVLCARCHRRRHRQGGRQDDLTGSIRRVGRGVAQSSEGLSQESGSVDVSGRGPEYRGRVDPLDGLNSEQRRAAETVRGPVCILAGAGTGKTTTITRRIAQQVATGAFRPDEIMAVTFTDKAGAQLRRRLAALGVQRVRAGTFHSAALRQLNHFAPESVGKIIPSKAIPLRQLG